MPSLFDQPPARRRGVMASTTIEAGADVSDATRRSQEERIIASLAAGPRTYHEIAERTGIALSVVCWRLGHLFEAEKVRVKHHADGAIAKKGRRQLVELMPSNATPARRAG